MTVPEPETTPETFAGIFTDLAETLVAEWADTDAERQFMSDPARTAEAADVEPCVRRFVELEFAQPKNPPGRGPMARAASIERVLEKQLALDDPQVRKNLEESVTVSLAYAYATFAFMQPQIGLAAPEAPSDPAGLWERWMLLTASTMLKDTLGGRTQEKKLVELAGAALENHLSKGGLVETKLFQTQSFKVGELSRFYGRAGMMLRLLQCTDRFDVKPSRAQRKAAPGWPFEGTAA